MDTPRYTTTTGNRNVGGLHRRIVERNQHEIDAARAAGDHERAELLVLRAVNYPLYVETINRAAARRHAAAVAGLPIDQRGAATA